MLFYLKRSTCYISLFLILCTVVFCTSCDYRFQLSDNSYGKLEDRFVEAVQNEEKWRSYIFFNIDGGAVMQKDSEIYVESGFKDKVDDLVSLMEVFRSLSIKAVTSENIEKSGLGYNMYKGELGFVTIDDPDSLCIDNVKLREFSYLFCDDGYISLTGCLNVNSEDIEVGALFDITDIDKAQNNTYMMPRVWEKY